LIFFRKVMARRRGGTAIGFNIHANLPWRSRLCEWASALWRLGAQPARSGSAAMANSNSEIGRFTSESNAREKFWKEFRDRSTIQIYVLTVRRPGGSSRSGESLATMPVNAHALIGTTRIQPIVKGAGVTISWRWLRLLRLRRERVVRFRNTAPVRDVARSPCTVR
jgi:hypothetical protein